MISPKKQMTKIVAEQTEDSSYEEILKELAFVRMVERVVADSRAKRTSSNVEVKRKIKSWQK